MSVTSIWNHSHNPMRVALIGGCDDVTNALQAHNIPLHFNVTLEEGEKHLADFSKYHIILVGLSLYPIRRRIIGELRHVNPDAAFVFLRRASSVVPSNSTGLQVRDQVVADFMLSSATASEVWRAAEALRVLFPLPNCCHLERSAEASLVEKAVKCVTAHFSDPALNLHSVAEMIGLSAGQLSRVLNQHAGVHFRQLLQQTRLEAAKQLLATGHDSIKEVAYSVGFSDSDYFSRAFKRYTGTCATTYRLNPAA